MVIHTSFLGNKPKLHKGDTILVSGIWKRSRRGEYLSIRAGHNVILLQQAKPLKKVKQAKKKLRKANKKPLGIARAQAAPPDIFTPAQLLGQNTGNEATEMLVLPYSPAMRWLFIGVISLGVMLLVTTDSSGREKE